MSILAPSCLDSVSISTKLHSRLPASKTRSETKPSKGQVELDGSPQDELTLLIGDPLSMDELVRYDEFEPTSERQYNGDFTGREDPQTLMGSNNLDNGVSALEDALGFNEREDL